MQLYHDRHYSAAYGRLAQLADNSHTEAARIALLMRDWMEDVSATPWPAPTGSSSSCAVISIDGREAERIGLVSLCVPPDKLMQRSMAIADKLASGSQIALRHTKKSLNGWLDLARPIFEHSLALEMLSFMDEDAAEGIAAVRERRAPVFPSAKRSRSEE